MIKEVEIRKKKGLSRFLNNAPDIRDFVFFPPLPPPPLLPPPNFSNPRPPPPPSHLFDIPNALRVDKFLNNNDFKFDFSNGYVPPAPDTIQDIFSQTDHRQLKLHQTWEQIRLKLHQMWEQIWHKQ